MLAPKQSQMAQTAEGPHDAAFRRARPTSRSASTACRPWCGFVTSRQIEAARIAISRHVKRGGKVYIRIFPDKPITKKPAETRMGHGKGNPEEWVAVVRPGRVMYELEGRRREAGARGVPPGRAQALGPDALPVAGGAGCEPRSEGPARERSATSCAARCASWKRICSSTAEEDDQSAREHDADPQHAPRHRPREHRPRRASARRSRSPRHEQGRGRLRRRPRRQLRSRPRRRPASRRKSAKATSQDAKATAKATAKKTVKET